MTGHNDMFYYSSSHFLHTFQLKKDREYELLKLNENKLLDLWRPRLRKLKNEELLEDFQVNKLGHHHMKYVMQVCFVPFSIIMQKKFPRLTSFT